MDTTRESKAFGLEMRELRTQQGLSQMELAARAGCSQRFISELERGKSTAEIGKALAVATALGYRVSFVRASSSHSGLVRNLADYL